MRKLLVVLWILIPVGLLAYHYGPGQERLARDRAARQLRLAHAAETRDDWRAANVAYGQALVDLPNSDVDARLAVKLAQAQARMYVGELPEATQDVEGLLDDALRDSKDVALQDQIRSTAGSMHYYVGWLRRRGGAEKDGGREQPKAARQLFRLRAEEPAARADPATADHEKNLEAAIRLER